MTEEEALEYDGKENTAVDIYGKTRKIAVDASIQEKQVYISFEANRYTITAVLEDETEKTIKLTAQKKGTIPKGTKELRITGGAFESIYEIRPAN